jgi:outer membrane protein OmpA-like peptidoglycan-associated protein
LGGDAGALDANPAEVFLIEGHTDATGKAAMNLALSDRRAESVALALTEYFDIPPENMVVQGYGESELLIDSQGANRQPPGRGPGDHAPDAHRRPRLTRTPYRRAAIGTPRGAFISVA